LDPDCELPGYWSARPRLRRRYATGDAIRPRPDLGTAARRSVRAGSDRGWDLRRGPDQRFSAGDPGVEHHQLARTSPLRDRGHRIPRTDRGLLRLPPPARGSPAARVGAPFVVDRHPLSWRLHWHRLRRQAIGPRTRLLGRSNHRLGVALAGIRTTLVGAGWGAGSSNLSAIASRPPGEPRDSLR